MFIYCVRVHDNSIPEMVILAKSKKRNLTEVDFAILVSKKIKKRRRGETDILDRPAVRLPIIDPSKRILLPRYESNKRYEPADQQSNQEDKSEKKSIMM